MADLQEQPVWEDGIYQLELTDPAEGGPGGVANRQAQELANRTAYLKPIADDVVAARGGESSLADRVLQIDVQAEQAAARSPCAMGVFKLAAGAHALLGGWGWDSLAPIQKLEGLDVYEALLAEVPGSEVGVQITISGAGPPYLECFGTWYRWGARAIRFMMVQPPGHAGGAADPGIVHAGEPAADDSDHVRVTVTVYDVSG